MKHLIAKLIPHADPDYYIERLTTYPEGEWFDPINSIDHDDYSICFDLLMVDLIARKRVPIWKDGIFKGNRVYYMYKMDLEYKESKEQSHANRL